MARYKHSDVESGQGLFLTVNLKEQLLPGTFEYMLDDLIGTKIDVSIFDGNYQNDEAGSKAIPPAALIKLIIYGYSKGMGSSRKLWELSRNNIIAKALTGDLAMHWTTIAHCISGNAEKFQRVFAQALAYCGELGLIGGAEFAIDGLRLPSNASMGMSGTKAELERKLAAYRRMAEKHVARHQRHDGEAALGEEEQRRYDDRQAHLKRQVEKLGSFIAGMEGKEGQGGQELKSNVTDNESALILGPSGYVQGYIGIAVADKQSQVVLSADAVGSANEGGHLAGMVDATLGNLQEAGVALPEGQQPVFMGDPNYFSEDNLAACKERSVEAAIPDGQHRQRVQAGSGRRYEAMDFGYDAGGDYYTCPNGKRLECKGAATLGGREGKAYQASAKDCRACPSVGRCLRGKQPGDAVRKGRKLFITHSNGPGSLGNEMRKKLLTEEGQRQYAYRIQIIEPVFANIAYCKGLKRFTLRGKRKVSGQWKLYCLVHNLGKCLVGYNARKGAA